MSKGPQLICGATEPEVINCKSVLLIITETNNNFLTSTVHNDFWWNKQLQKQT